MIKFANLFPNVKFISYVHNDYGLVGFETKSSGRNQLQRGETHRWRLQRLLIARCRGEGETNLCIVSILLLLDTVRRYI